MKTLKLIVASLILSFPAYADGSSHGNHSGHGAGMAIEGAVHAKATINAIGDGTANVTHGPIPEIGWPAMTMDLPLAEGANMMGDVAPGNEVTMMLVKGADGMFAIGGIMPE